MVRERRWIGVPCRADVMIMMAKEEGDGWKWQKEGEEGRLGKRILKGSRSEWRVGIGGDYEH